MSNSCMDAPRGKRGPYNGHELGIRSCPSTTKWRKKEGPSHCNTTEIDALSLDKAFSDHSGTTESTDHPGDEPSKDPTEVYADDDEAEEEPELNDFQADSGNEDDKKRTDRLLYDGARITLATSMLLIVSFVIRHNLPGEALTDIITLIELHCALPNIFAQSTKMFKDFFRGHDTPIDCHYYCDRCHIYNGKSKECCICLQNLNNSYFIMLPMIEQFQKIISGRFKFILDCFI